MMSDYQRNFKYSMENLSRESAPKVVKRNAINNTPLKPR